MLGDIPVDVITEATLTDYASQRARVASNATIRRDLTALSRLLACCVAWGYREGSPVRGYDRSLLRERREPIQPPDPADVVKVIAAAPSAMAGILRMLDQTGMRSQEAVQLEAHNLSFPRCRCPTCLRDVQIRLTRTKTGRPRTIPVVTPCGDVSLLLRDAPMVGAVFTASTGRPYRNFAIHAAKVIAAVAACEAASPRPFRKFRVHDLRHGFAIRALRAGMNIYSLSRHLGHSSVKTTEIYLDHLSETEPTFAQTGAQAV